MKRTIKELRARSGKTQNDVAKDLGISVQTYNHWENNIQELRVSKAQQLAEYYNVTLDDIFLG